MAKISIIKSSKICRPYVTGKLNPELLLNYKVNQIGIYIIYRRGEIIYVGRSTWNLYKVFSRHFQTWNDEEKTWHKYAPQRKIHYHALYSRNDNNLQARIIYVKRKSDAELLEEKLLIKYQPKDNRYIPSKIDAPF